MFKLTDDQHKALEEIKDFMHHPTDNMHCLVGKAGTGKSTLIKELIPLYNPLITATTNKAVSVLNSIIPDGFNRATTVHRLLNLVVAYPSLRQTHKPDLHTHLIIIDECSTVGEELFKYIKEFLEENPCTKVLFCGDPAQLPPVKEHQSPTFKESHTASMLNDVVRQSKGSSLLALCNTLRDFALVMKPSKEHILDFLLDMHNGEDIVLIYEDDVLSQAITTEMLRDDWSSQDSKYISFTNNASVKINNGITALKTGTTLICDGDIMSNNTYINNTDYGYKISTDESVIIDDVYHDEIRYDVLGCVVQIDGIPFFSPYDYKDIKKTKSKFEKLAEYHTVKDIQNTWIDLRHAYGLTTHKSQGCTFTTVFMDFKDISKSAWDYYLFLRLLYVTASRATDKLVIRV